MFIRVKKIGAYEYLDLVANAREGGRHVQRVIVVSAFSTPILGAIAGPATKSVLEKIQGW